MFRVDPTTGEFVNAEDLDPADGDSSDPLAPTLSVADLSEEFGEAFAVAVLTTVSDFRFDHWVDGRRVRWIERRGATAPVRMAGEPEDWEAGCILEDDVLASRAFEAVLDHFGVEELVPAAIERGRRMSADPHGDVRRMLPELLGELEIAIRSLHTAQSREEVRAIRERVTAPQWMTTRIAEDAEGLAELASRVEALHQAAAAAWERVGDGRAAASARRSLVWHWVALGIRLEDALSTTRALLDAEKNELSRSGLWLLLARALARAGQTSAAIDAAERAVTAVHVHCEGLDLDGSEIASVVGDAALIAQDCGASDRAIEWLERALEASESDEYLWLALARALVDAGRPSDAMNAARLAIASVRERAKELDMDPLDLDLADRLGEAASVANACGDVDQEIEWLERALADPPEPNDYEERLDAARASKSRS